MQGKEFERITDGKTAAKVFTKREIVREGEKEREREIVAIIESPGNAAAKSLHLKFALERVRFPEYTIILFEKKKKNRSARGLWEPIYRCRREIGKMGSFAQVTLKFV